MTTAGWTYGAEHELGDWDRTRPLPPGFGIDEDDVTVMNSDGTAADPRARITTRGGELNTPPTDTPLGQAGMLDLIRRYYPEATVNHRSNLHIHVRVPGLCDDLPALKRLARYVRDQCLDGMLKVIEPIPEPSRTTYPDPEEYEGARRRWRRRRISHHTVLPYARLHRQLQARTVEEFHRAEVPATRATGRPMWHAQPRAAINIRQLMETDTIEFRHFPGTLVPEEVHTAVSWCRDFLADGLGPQRGWRHVHNALGYAASPWPTFPPYVHWMEVRFRATVLDGSIPRAVAAANVQRILRGEFTP